MLTTILGLETSCDETAAAIVCADPPERCDVLANIVATQHDLHERYAGVVPEIASRAHVERLVPVIDAALGAAGLALADLDAVAVGNRPGLVGSLIVGLSAAKALAWALERPLIGVDHVEAHLYAGRLSADPIAFPALGLVVSGGHTHLFRLADPVDVTVLGRTRDDAVGEAFDKAAAMLGIGYPGGPHIDALARTGRDDAHDFPVSRLDRESLDFSFSGLKTALLYTVRGQPERRGDDTVFPRRAADLDDHARADLAASFERAAIDAVMLKLGRARERHSDCPTLLAGGGVCANTRLRAELTAFAERHALDLRLPPMEYCIDNAAMIAALAAEHLARGRCADWTLAASAAR